MNAAFNCLEKLIETIYFKNIIITNMNNNYIYNDEKGQFITTGDDGIFSWIVYGSRSKINVEPNKIDVSVEGEGPYRFINFIN